jgi:hypothetical protein
LGPVGALISRLFGGRNTRIGGGLGQRGCALATGMHRRSGGPMKIFPFACAFAVVMILAQNAARAEDIVAMISQYRREHGLPPVKVDAKFAAIAERQAKAMAASGIMDHDVAGSFSSRIADAHTDSAAENIAAGTKTWADTLRMWKNSPGHNANLLLADADLIGVAVARNDQTRFKTFWSMEIGHKAIPESAVARHETSQPRHQASQPIRTSVTPGWLTDIVSSGRKFLFGE